MTYSRRLTVHVSSVALILGTSAIALGQVDVNPPRPNVMLLVDSSGSMEYTTSAQTFPVCDPTSATSSATVNNKSRWINLVEALTGNIPNFRCEAISRNTSRFLSEYKVAETAPTGTPNPPDYLYTIPYHRPMSGTCAPTPGTNKDSIGYCKYNGTRPCTTQDCSADDTKGLAEAGGGLLDAFKQQIRFGLMTFDTLPNASEGIDGTWTYTYGNAVVGAPKDCTETKPQDVGARNALAPLWEGRLVAFGPPRSANELYELEARNQQIQQALLATRPFGATPIAGMLKDVRDFFWNDPDPDDSHNTPPKDDPYITGKCRSNFIILLTDGEPNMDLRPFCENPGVNPVCGPNPGDCCPFEKAEDIAHSLALGINGTPVQTYVIGFAVSQSGNESKTAECATLTDIDLTSSDGLCAKATSSELKVCCNLNQIAYNGGTARAYFADSVEGLRTSLADILNKAAKGSTSRTFPVFASATGSNSGASSFRFYTSFKARISGTGLWPGVIERQRFVCEKGVANLMPIDPTKGDDFVNNVNSVSTPARRFFSVIGETSGAAINSTRTIRTYGTAAARDGAGNYTGTLVNGTMTTFPGRVPPLAMNIAKCTSETGTNLTVDACRDRYVKWLVGDDNGSTEKYHRCAASGSPSCSLVADVYHSVPALVNRPSENLRDESYQRFALSEQRKRPLVLYTSTNDGFLHAFKVASNDIDETTADAKVETRTNNELWAFMPPAVLPRIADEYPNAHFALLDGAPMTRDVAGYKELTTGAIKFERNLTTIGSNESIWRTVLVQSFGGAYPGYFALDITDPVTGPQFLWQLTTDASGEQLFGASGSTPTITTLYFDPDGGSTPREIAVALLPGGDGGTPPDTTSECQRNTTDFGIFETTTKPRTNVPCYTSEAARRARSLTVVRLDTGELIRTFRYSAVDGPTSIASLVGQHPDVDSPLDAPITGQPVAYPGWTGAIADRAYVGDRDGALWRIDLTATDPMAWTMKLFFDAYHGKTAHAGQPVANAPILSLNDLGEVVIAFSTGNQEDLVSTSSTETFLYSLGEKAADALNVTVKPSLNWFYRFTGGERITGPLTLFSNGLYFSTYAPPTNANDACSNGTSRVGGMHYLKLDAESTESVPGDVDSRGGTAMLPLNGDSSATTTEQFYDQTDALFAQGSVIFGVGVAQVPSCFETSTVSDDPFFGTSHTQTTMTSPATYQLVMQTGTQGTATTGGTTNTVSVNLPPPDTSPRIDSWALVMD